MPKKAIAATEEFMSKLHKLTAERIMSEILNPKSDPRFVQMAAKFLNDNSVHMVKEVGDELDELSKELKKRKKRRFNNTPEETEAEIIDISTQAALDLAGEG